MDYIVELLHGDKLTVSLPARLPNGRTFPLTVAGEDFTASWDRQTGLLVLLGKNGLERTIRVRSRHVGSDQTSATTPVAAEVWLGTTKGVRTLQATVSPDVPGQEQRRVAAGNREQVVRSQITGKVLEVLVHPGEAVAAGATLVIIEAMKMENRVFAVAGGTVLSVAVGDGDAVQTGKELLRITP